MYSEKEEAIFELGAESHFLHVSVDILTLCSKLMAHYNQISLVETATSLSFLVRHSSCTV